MLTRNSQFFCHLRKESGWVITIETKEVTEKDKEKVISEIKEYHKQDLYDNFDLHDIADNTSKEEEINDYLYTKNYEYDDKDFNI